MTPMPIIMARFGRELPPHNCHSRLHSVSKVCRPGTKDGFTLVELLVVVVVVALLAAMLLPAMAGIKDKGGRTQCASNLRQIGMASMMYANDYNGWFPTGQIGANPANVIRGLYYSRFFWMGTSNTKVTPQSIGFQNAGHLFQTGFVQGNGEVFYCPAQWGTEMGADYPTPFITSDSSGNVRTSYGFNPRVVNASGTSYADILRRYQKTSQLEPHKLFGVDFFYSGEIFAHSRERGWNILFTDCSVSFSKSDRAYQIIKIYGSTVGQYYDQYTDTLFDTLELDH